jgi:hypothetical protein
MKRLAKVPKLIALRLSVPHDSFAGMVEKTSTRDSGRNCQKAVELHREKHGAGCVITDYHGDEASACCSASAGRAPHDGVLNAKHFSWWQARMRGLRGIFYKQVEESLPRLARGQHLKGSNAEHVPVLDRWAASTRTYGEPSDGPHNLRKASVHQSSCETVKTFEVLAIATRQVAKNGGRSEQTSVRRGSENSAGT